MAVKIVLDNGLILNLLSQNKSTGNVSKLPSGAISVYQSHKNLKRRPQVQLISVGALQNVAEEKAERLLARQKSAKAVLGIPARRESSKKLTKANSVKSLRSKGDAVMSRDEIKSGATSLTVPAFGSKKAEVAKDKDKKKK